MTRFQADHAQPSRACRQRHPAPPLKVIHVVLSLDVGGLERVVLSLVRQGQARGQRVAVICLERHGTLAAEAESLNARVLCVEKRPGIRPGTMGRLGAVLRELRPNIIHTHQIGALLYAGPAARATGIAVVHTEHGKHSSRRLRTRLLGCLAGRYAARVFCVSGDIAAGVIAHYGVPRRKVDVVPNGIDTAPFQERGDAEALRRSLGIPLGAPVVGTVGRLSEVKRQDRLVRAFFSITGRLPHAHLLLVGDGPVLRDLRELVQRLGLDGRVHFAGYQARPERFFQVMDVFALTSDSEGMPLAVLEAWAAGLPVVASRVGGLPKLITHGQTGVLFAPGDEGALTAALGAMLTDVELARRLGECGRRQLDSSFTASRMAAEYERHYFHVLTGDRGDRSRVFDQAAPAALKLVTLHRYRRRLLSGRKGR